MQRQGGYKKKERDERKKIVKEEKKKKRIEMQETLRKSRESGKQLEEALRSIAMGASTSKPSNPGRKCFNPPTTTVDASLEPDSTINLSPLMMLHHS